MNLKEFPERIFGEFNSIIDLSLHSNWSGPGRRPPPKIKSIPVDHPFQIVMISVGNMHVELPLATNGSRYSLYAIGFTKCPQMANAMEYAAPVIIYS